MKEYIKKWRTNSYLCDNKSLPCSDVLRENVKEGTMKDWYLKASAMFSVQIKNEAWGR